MKNEYTLEIHGMACEACNRLVMRSVAKHDGARAYDFDQKSNTVKIECEDGQLPKIREDLLQKGYQLLLPGEQGKSGYEAGSLKRATDFAYGLVAGAPHLAWENRVLYYAFMALVIMLIAYAGLYIAVFKANVPNFISRYGTTIFLSSVSIVAVLFSFYHVRAFRKKTSCMSGMMIGMTIGMMGGFLMGAFAGATNGMFIGSLVGMAFGMAIGFEAGRCCGVMGAMEGAMGGLMAGTMGAMLSVMMIYDNLIPFLYILTGACIAILGALSYMTYKEFGSVEGEKFHVSPTEFFIFSIAISLLLSAIAIYGPKSSIVWLG